jgi:hypothetical protein
MGIGSTAFGSALVAVTVGSGFAQDESARGSALTRSTVGKHSIALDIGVLEGGLSYVRRIGNGPFAIGGRVWAAWEPWNSFSANVIEPVGGELLVRYHPNREVQLELGPSLLRYRRADECTGCGGTFAGVYATAMVGRGIFALGPTARFGVLTGAPSGRETGIIWGFQGRLRFSGND